MKNNNTEAKIFKTEEECKNFLAELFAKVKKVGDFNILLHQISCQCYNRQDRGLTLENRINGILERGISTTRYPTITATTMFAGSVNSNGEDEIDIQDILNYRYYDSEDKYICVLAIPKFVDVNGQSVEFSSFEGFAGGFCDNKKEIMSKHLKDAYNLETMNMRDLKYSLFDAVKSDRFNKHYLLGIVHIDPSIQHYGMLVSHEHLFENADTYKVHNEYYSEQIEKLYNKFQTKDTATIITKSYKEEQDYWDTLTMEDID
ncbi:MAG: hypothetical protein ACI4R8_01415 [Candidatus Caccovivens sp.]